MRIEAHEIQSIGLVQCFLDGRKLDHVVAADDTTGWALIADTNADGSIKINRQRGEVVYRKVFGSIRFVIQYPYASAKGRRWLSGRRPS